MKIYSSKILDKIEGKKEIINPILFYGSESGLISGLIKSIFEKFRNTFEISEIKYIDYKNDKGVNLEDVLNSPSLFSDISFIVIKNPQEKIIDDLKNIKKIDHFVLINGENIKSNSKLKIFFDSHSSFMGVPCYALDKAYIKKIADDFLKHNNIKLENDAYWYLIENIVDDYLSLQNEIQKLYIYQNSSANLNDIRNLISQKNNIGADNFFFNCISGNSSLILKEMDASNKSSADSYEIFISLKSFVSMLANAVANKDSYDLNELVRKYFPRYLFKKDPVFKNAILKTDLKKISRINSLIQKTELLLRKNSVLHKEILERLLLNLTKMYN